MAETEIGARMERLKNDAKAWGRRRWSKVNAVIAALVAGITAAAASMAEIAETMKGLIE